MIKSDLKASVLINTYNHGPLLDEAVKSALEQTCPSNQYEVIVVNDGSTDDTKERLARYGNAIRAIHLENSGQAAAYNTGIREAQSDVVLFLDGDDLMHTERVDKVSALFQDPDVVLVLNGREIFSETRNFNAPSAVAFEPQIVTRENVLQFVRMGYGSSRTAARTSVLTNLGMVPEGFPINADIFLMALMFYGKVASLEEPLTKYRVHPGNTFHREKESQLVSNLSSLEYYTAAFRVHARKGPYYEEPCLQALSAYYKFSIEQRRFKLLCKANAASRWDVLSFNRSVVDAHRHGWTPVMLAIFYVKLFVKLILGPKMYSTRYQG